jgi:shikimate kinase
MTREGTAVAPAAGTIVNALATGVGSAFAIDREVTASVTLDDSEAVTATVAEAPYLDPEEDPDTRLVERCVERVLDLDEVDPTMRDRYTGGHVRTESEVAMAAGLKSSSAAANATVLATSSALSVDLDPVEACRVGVEAARDVGVTVTGAFDDASASMLGGVTVTDNTEDELLDRAAFSPDRAVLVYTPPARAYSADADVARCRRVAPMADLATDLALDGRYGTAMTVNGFAFAAALDFPSGPLVEALPLAEGVSVSGTGPSVTAIGERDRLRDQDTWDGLNGRTWLTTTRTDGARAR